MSKKAVWILLAICLAAGSLRLYAGFSFPLPPNYNNPTSAKRNHVFYVGEPVTFNLLWQGTKAIRYEVRNYYGDLVVSGVPAAAAPFISLPTVTAPGWYKLSLFGPKDQGAPWGTSVGATHFVILRRNANFPALPAPGTSGGGDPFGDEVIRGVTGMGPQRIRVTDPANADAAIAMVQKSVDIDKAMYLPFDPVRKRRLLVAFPNGTWSADGSRMAGIKKIIQHFQNDVLYWEGQNEPDGSSTPDAYVSKELLPFYEAVKSINPALKVVAPAVTSIKKADWINSFLTLAGTNYDAFSFHAYNNVNGDLWLTRQCLNDLHAMLQAHGRGGVEVWQTEQGYFAAMYGSFQPRHQAAWTMLQMMVYEQNGIPKEHNHLWYDVSHGFWNIPAFWENSDTCLNPVVPLMRVWSEELFGATWQSAYDFGTEQNVYLGSLFAGSGKNVAAFMTAGSPAGTVALGVTGGTTLQTVSPFGVSQALPVTGGTVQLPVSELPTYVELAAGQTIRVIPRTYGENLARRPGVTFKVNGAADPNTSKLVNGVLDTWYYKQSTTIPGTAVPQDPGTPWRIPVNYLPVTVEMDLPATATISDVLLYAAIPWQFDSTLLDYDLQYWNGAAWITLSTVTEPTKTWKAYSPATRCTVESYFSDRSIFEHHFAPVTTSKLRLNIRSVTWGGGATAEVYQAGGQSQPPQIVLREWEVYQSPSIATAAKAAK